MENELVILVGMQGSGKTYYCRTMLPDHYRLSQDEGPRTFPAVVKRLEALLAEGVAKIVIDRTNPRRDQREIFARLARRAGYRVRVVYFDLARDVCRRRIESRSGHPTLAPQDVDGAIARYLQDLSAPTAGECDELAIVRQ